VSRRRTYSVDMWCYKRLQINSDHIGLALMGKSQDKPKPKPKPKLPTGVVKATALQAAKDALALATQNEADAGLGDSSSGETTESLRKSEEV
jgi:hypothetical protein